MFSSSTILVALGETSSSKHSEDNSSNECEIGILEAKIAAEELINPKVGEVSGQQSKAGREQLFSVGFLVKGILESTLVLMLLLVVHGEELMQGETLLFSFIEDTVEDIFDEEEISEVRDLEDDGQKLAGNVLVETLLNLLETLFF